MYTNQQRNIGKECPAEMRITRMYARHVNQLIIKPLWNVSA